MGVYGQNARPLTVTIDGSALTYEAMEVAAAHIRDLEQKYAVNPDSVTDLGTLPEEATLGAYETVVLTGKTPYKVFIFEVAFSMADATYVFTCNEVAPNVETSTTL